MFLRWTTMALALLALVCIVSTPFANRHIQASDRVPAGNQTWEELVQQWQQLEGRLREAAAEFEAAGPEARPAARERYMSLIAEANELMQRMADAAAERLRQDPEDREAASVLLQIIANAAAQNNDRQALSVGQRLIDAGVDREQLERLMQPGAQEHQRYIVQELLIRHRENEADDLPRVRLETNRGDIVLELFENEAPQTVGNFVHLVENDFYSDVRFHRVIEGFMAQGGCPEGTGTGGPGYRIYCESQLPEFRRHFTGSLSMAHAGRDTGGSQFFLTFRRTDHLDRNHTVFGRVIEGQDVLDQINRTQGADGQPTGAEPDRIVRAEVIRKRDHEYRPSKVGEGPPPRSRQSDNDR